LIRIYPFSVVLRRILYYAFLPDLCAVCGNGCHDETRDKILALGAIPILQPNRISLCCNINCLSGWQLYSGLEGRENQSFLQIVLHVFSSKFLKINRFEGIFSGYLKDYCRFLGC